MAQALQCRICFEDASDPRVTVCGHTFCREHINEWFKNQRICPVCRRSINPDLELIPLYLDADESSPTTAEQETKANGNVILDLRTVTQNMQTLSGAWERTLMERARMTSKIRELEDKCRDQQRKLEELEKENRILRSNDGVTDPSPVSQSAPMYITERCVNPWVLRNTFSVHSEPVHGIAVHPTRNLVGTASWDKNAVIFDLDRKDVMQYLRAHQSGLYDIDFSRVAVSIAGTTSSDKRCCLWNIDTGRCVRELNGHKDEVNAVNFHWTEALVATASDDHRACIWDMETGVATNILSGHTQPVYDVAFQPNTQLVATVGFDSKLKLWDTRTDKEISSLSGHKDDIIGVDLDEGGTLIATGSDDKTCRIWDLRQQRAIQVIGPLAGEVKRVAFSPYGRVLATGSGDTSARIWDMKNFQEVCSLQGHADHVFDVAWSPLCDFLVTASHDTRWKQWVPSSFESAQS